MMATVLERIAPAKPKGLEAGTIAWFNACVERGKREAFAETTKLVPGLAEHMLNFNPENRKMKPVKVGQYATDIVAGDWKLNGETIIFAKDGVLNDGQNRLMAVVEAGLPIDTFVVFGVERSTRTTVDQGAARTAGDYLAMLGVSNGHQIAGITRLVKAFEDSDGKSVGKAKDYTNAEVVQRGLADEKTHAAACYANSAARFTRQLAAPSIVGACLYILSNEHEADAREYMNQVAYGENIRRGDPAFAVRTALANLDRPDKSARMEIIFRGWNAFRQNRPLALAKTLGTFPALI